VAAFATLVLDEVPDVVAMRAEPSSVSEQAPHPS
jgi:hypothetical protein